MDEQLRALERAWLETRDPEAGERYRVALVRAGALEAEDPLEGPIQTWVPAPGEVLHTRWFELMEGLLGELGVPWADAEETRAGRPAEGTWGGWVNTTRRTRGELVLELERTEEPKVPGESQDRSTSCRASGLPGGVLLWAEASGGNGDLFLGFTLEGPSRSVRELERSLGRVLTRRALAGAEWSPSGEASFQPPEWRERARALLDRAFAPRGAPHGWLVVDDGPVRLGIELAYGRLSALGPLPRRLSRLSLQERAYRPKGRQLADPEHQELFLALTGRELELEQGQPDWGRFGGDGWFGFYTARLSSSGRVERTLRVQHPERFFCGMNWAWEEGALARRADATLYVRLVGPPDELKAAAERVRAVLARWNAER